MRRTTGVGPCLSVLQSFHCNLTLFKADTSLRRTVAAGPLGGGGGVLKKVDCIFNLKNLQILLFKCSISLLTLT